MLPRRPAATDALAECTEETLAWLAKAKAPVIVVDVEVRRFGVEDRVAALARKLGIPVVANGDIDSPAKAIAVLRATGADGIMIGRAAQGRPWIFAEIEALLLGRQLPPPATAEVRDIMLTHLRDLYEFYGAESGVRIARKHIGWYCAGRPQAQAFRQSVMQAVSVAAQLSQVQDYFDALEAAGAAVAA